METVSPRSPRCTAGQAFLALNHSLVGMKDHESRKVALVGNSNGIAVPVDFAGNHVLTGGCADRPNHVAMLGRSLVGLSICRRFHSRSPIPPAMAQHHR